LSSFSMSGFRLKWVPPVSSSLEIIASWFEVLSLLPMVDQVNHRSGVGSSIPMDEHHYITTGVTRLKWLQLRRHPTCSLIPPAEYGNLEPPDRARGVGEVDLRTGWR
jgi:hypothetical protein